MQSPPILELMTQQIAAERGRLVEEAREQAAGVKHQAQARAKQRREEILHALEHELAEAARRVRERAGGFVAGREQRAREDAVPGAVAHGAHELRAAGLDGSDDGLGRGHASGDDRLAE